MAITMSRLMLLMDGNPWIRRRPFVCSRKRPALFAKMLAIHTEARPLSSVGVTESRALAGNSLGPDNHASSFLRSEDFWLRAFSRLARRWLF